MTENNLTRSCTALTPSDPAVISSVTLLSPSVPSLTPETLIAALKGAGSVNDPVLTRQEASEWSKLSLSTLDRLIKSGELQVIRFGRAVRIRKSALEALLRKHMSNSKELGRASCA